MRRLSLNMVTDNAAFRHGDESLNVCALQEALLSAVERLTGAEVAAGEHLEVLIRDVNGNTVGSLYIDESV
mgnify:CR=1 FL=1